MSPLLRIPRNAATFGFRPLAVCSFCSARARLLLDGPMGNDLRAERIGGRFLRLSGRDRPPLRL
jgi:hypothetical protein